MSTTAASPDDVCLVCGTTREYHGDKRHQFNMVDDQLLPLKPPPERRAEPPTPRGETSGETFKAASFATLIEVLVEKNMIDAHDVIRIFGGRG